MMFTPLLDGLLISVLPVPLIGLIGRKVGHEEALVAAYITSVLAVSLLMIPLYYWETAWGKGTITTSPSPEGVSIKVDGLSIFVAMILFTVGMASSAFSAGEARGISPGGYYTIYLGMIASIVGVLFAESLFTFFIFWEAMCLCSYALVAFRRERPEPIEAGYKYLLMSSAGAIIILFAFSLLYGLTGTLSIPHLAAGLAEAGGDPIVQISLLMMIVGFGIQAGMAPFHTWLPDAHMAAPSPISAILSGVVVKIGIYGLIRLLLTVFLPEQNAWQTVLATFAVLTMFLGNLSALFQDDLKRLLAYSTVANTGYVLLGLAFGSQRALAGSLFQMMNHALIKALLFLCAGAFLHSAGTRSLSEIAGIRRTMPVTSLAFAVGSLALATFPGLNMFWSELMIITAGIESGMTILSLLMILNLALSAAYALRMIYTVTVMKATSKSRKASEAPAIMLLPILSLATISVMIGVYPSPLISLTESTAASFNL
ncbi:MAG: multicomponent Na+:H+ antiporter subunit D [Candidatus Bathyarchaeota archaeon B63]|nr:MAG: multicomponent Na+:H+ antiporter subunit D [Candidatus Bathyarchaeota archaeon B63]